MSVPSTLTDGIDTASIQNAALTVTQIPSPNGNQITIPFVQPLTIQGDGVTTNLKVDGSTNNIRAFIESESDGDVYVTQINAVILGTIGGGNALLSDFAAVTGGLTNGCVLFAEIEGNIIEYTEVDLKTNFQWVSLGSLTASLGEDAAAFRVQNVIPGNNSFGYIPRLDMKELAPPFGIRLKSRGSDQLGIIIRDDLTVATVSAFQLTAIGFKIITP